MSEKLLSREEIEALAHRICLKYGHSENPESLLYTFGVFTLMQFVSELEKAWLAKLRCEKVGQADNMPGVEGFTMAVFREEDVPSGTNLYTLKEKS